MHEVKSNLYFTPALRVGGMEKITLRKKIKVKIAFFIFYVTEIYECNNKLNKPTFSFIWQLYYQKKHT